MENIELGPLPPAPASRGRTRAQGYVLAAVREHGPGATIAALAGATGLHENTLRGHLDALTADGLLVRERSEPSGRGRPAWRWRPAPDAHSEYAGLAAALARTLKATSSHPAADAIEAGRTWGQELAGERAPSGRGPDHDAVALLDGLGFAPRSAGSADEVRLTRCPLLEAAKEEPTIVCNVHLGLVAGAMETYGAADPDVELTPFAEPGACLLRISAG